MNFTYIWRYNKTTGLWAMMRNSLPENAKAWLKVYQSDEPGEFFKISINKPYGKPKGF